MHDGCCSKVYNSQPSGLPLSLEIMNGSAELFVVSVNRQNPTPTLSSGPISLFLKTDILR